MRRCRRGGNNVKRRVRRLLLLAVFIGLLLCAASFFLVVLVMEPNLDDVARIRAEVVVSRTINRALAEQFRENGGGERLFTVENGEDGTLEMVQADSMAINIFMSELSVNIQEAFQEMEAERYPVPAGALLGSKLLSQTGPQVPLSIIPMSVSSMDFRTEFQEQGINQTKYKIYIRLTCRIKVIAPFSHAELETANTVLIAEAVILGDVPHSYVQVPEEDILDVMEE